MAVPRRMALRINRIMKLVVDLSAFAKRYVFENGREIVDHLLQRASQSGPPFSLPETRDRSWKRLMRIR